MMTILRSGIPHTQDYVSVVDSSEFRKLERFSDDFLRANADVLQRYARRWVRDSLHQWSRQWEYMYVLSRLKFILGDSAAIILDAGSGITFFPYFLASRSPSVRVECIDNDPNLEIAFSRIEAQGKPSVTFSSADIKRMPYENDTFDVAYCVSVLEHTANYAIVLEEMSRVLKSGGKFILTFDISLDGTRNLSLDSTRNLLRTIEEKFDFADEIDLDAQLSEVTIFTSRVAAKIDADLLPWRYPAFLYHLKNLIMGRKIGAWPPQLTVFCAELVKK